MLSIETLTTFFGWCVVLNIGFIVLMLIAIPLLQRWIGYTASTMFGVTADEARLTVFYSFQMYRVATVMFSGVPYLALVAMS